LDVEALIDDLLKQIDNEASEEGVEINSVATASRCEL
jgi:hypothetical protein